MGIFARLAQLIKSNLNELVSRSEDPEKVLNQLVIDMNEQLMEAKKQVAVSIADEKHLAKQVEQEAANAAGWERRAMMAVRAGDDALAKEALARKKEHDSLREQYQEQWQKQKAAVEQLKTALRILNNKIEEAKRKKNVLIARKKRAEAQRSIHQTMAGLKNASAFETFDRMAAKIDRIEAEAEATAELSEEASGDQLADRFARMEVTTMADTELVALKRRMGLLPPEPAPAPPAVAEAGAERPQQLRVSASGQPAAGAAPPAGGSEQDELAAALAEVEAEQTREQERMKR